MSKARKKPLSFNTTMRNPERIAGFLSVLAKYENKILNNDLIESICADAIINKIYKPTSISKNPEWKYIYDSNDYFTRQEALEIMKSSPQNHKEAGFEKGWESRFDTWYKLIMEFGFCYYELNSPIEISTLGKELISAYSQSPADDNTIQNVFLNALVKFQTSTPFRKNANQNIPLLLLLNVLKLLKEDTEENGAGIYRKEICFFLCWPDNDAYKLYKYIKDFRKMYGYNYSDEVIYEKCLELFIDKKHPTIDTLTSYIKMSKLMNESPDEYIRKMRITGIISLRGNGRFLDFNTLEMDKIEYIIANYGTPYKIDNKRDYYNYLKTKDERLFISREKPVDDILVLKQNTLKKFAVSYSDEKLSEELILTYKGRCEDELLKFIDAPARLEFLTSIALVKYFNGMFVKPNYKVDDEGIPTFTARGGISDIECHYNNTYGLVEVTLMVGAAQQTEHEMTSISDHLKTASSETDEYTLALFVAPLLTERAKDYMEYMNERKLKNDKCAGIIPIMIENLVSKFKEVNSLTELTAIQ